MPKLSLYKPEKGADFKFLDRVINEQFQVGGTDIYIHKYVGPVNPATGTSTPGVPDNSSNPIPELGIQDLIFMENRDRHYEPDVYIIRGIYDMHDIDFNLSQFGLFLQNDTINIMLHLRSHYEALGRKIMAGDVIELPHQKDEYALDDSIVALKRFYVVQDVTRPAKGYSPTWYPHLVRAKCTPLIDSQEYQEILNADSGAGNGSTLKDLLSTYKKSIEINDQIIAQADLDVPLSGYDTGQYYVVPTTNTGLANVSDVSNTNTEASISSVVADASVVLQTPGRGDIFVTYMNGGSAVPPNGIPYNFGISFPSTPTNGEFFLRTDYLPNVLYRYNGSHWQMFETGVRMTLNNFGDAEVASGQTFAGKPVYQTQKGTFINNINTATIAGQVVPERQALSKALKFKPQAD